MSLKTPLLFQIAKKILPHGGRARWKVGNGITLEFATRRLWFGPRVCDIWISAEAPNGVQLYLWDSSRGFLVDQLILQDWVMEAIPLLQTALTRKEQEEDTERQEIIEALIKHYPRRFEKIEYENTE